ncbi:MAG: hypothetical protein WCA08_15280 [Desulfoferrobacter sp.]
MSGKYTDNPRNSGAKSESNLEFLSRTSCSPDEFEKTKKLLLTNWGDKWDTPLTVDELLEIGKAALEPLFHEPPIGPIPEYLGPHFYVHGCVAEYEERLEQLDRWKSQQLSLWLNKLVGEKLTIKGKVYELRSQKENLSAAEQYWFELIEHLNKTNAE